LSFGATTFGGGQEFFDAWGATADVAEARRNEEQLRQNLGAVGWNLTKEQVARLDKASAVTLTYPYWHQHLFTERNAFPV
jgi:hypothetical protein